MMQLIPFCIWAVTFYSKSTTLLQGLFMQSRTVHAALTHVQSGTMEIAAVPGWYLAEERKDAGPFFFFVALNIN